MNMNIISLLVIGSILSHTVSSLIDKKIADYLKEHGKGSSFSAAMFKVKSNLIVFSPLVFVFWDRIVAGGIELLSAAFVLGVLYGFSFELYFRGLSKKEAEASILFPFQLSVTLILVYVSSGFVFLEELTLLRSLSVFGVLLGIILMFSVPGQRISFKRLKDAGILLFFAMVLIDVFYELSSKAFSLSVEDSLVLVGEMYMFSTFILLFLNRGNIIAKKEEYVYTWKLFLKNWQLLFLGSVTALLGRGLFYEALMHGGELSYVTPFFVSGQMLLLTVGGIILFKEKTYFRKTLGIMVLFFFVTLLSIS